MSEDNQNKASNVDYAEIVCALISEIIGYDIRSPRHCGALLRIIKERRLDLNSISVSELKEQWKRAVSAQPKRLRLTKYVNCTSLPDSPDEVPITYPEPSNGQYEECASVYVQRILEDSAENISSNEIQLRLVMAKRCRPRKPLYHPVSDAVQDVVDAAGTFVAPCFDVAWDGAWPCALGFGHEEWAPFNTEDIKEVYKHIYPGFQEWAYGEMDFEDEADAVRRVLRCYAVWDRALKECRAFMIYPREEENRSRNNNR